MPPSLPPYLQPGSRITINLADSAGTLHATVSRGLPITTSQLVVARLDEKAQHSSISLSVGSEFVLKIFDPRFIKRRFNHDNIPWSYEAEEAATHRHHCSISNWQWRSPPESEDPAVDWEEYYYVRCSNMRFFEVAGYSRLVALQGSGVPVFYGYGSLDLSNTTPPRAIQPPVILIEYIQDAVTLKDVDARLLSRPLIRSLLDTVQRIGELGVCHGDPNYGNILLAPAHQPVRAALIDFDDCIWYDSGITWEDWCVEVASNGEVRETKRKIRKRLEDAGLEVPEECRPEVYT